MVGENVSALLADPCAIAADRARRARRRLVTGAHAAREIYRLEVLP